MSEVMLPNEDPSRASGGRNLLTLARPFFGLIFADDDFADRGRHLRRAADAQRNLSRSGVSADRGDCANAGPFRERRRDRHYAADRRRREHRRGSEPRALEIAARRGGDRGELRARHRYGAGPERRPRADGGGRIAASAGHQHDCRAANAVGIPDHIVRRDGRARSGGFARLRLLRPASADQPHWRRVASDGLGRRYPRDSRRSRARSPRRRRIVDRRGSRPPRQGTSLEGRGPARSGNAAISSARQHAGDRSVRFGKFRDRAKERPRDSRARRGTRGHFPCRPQRRHSLRRQAERRSHRLSPVGRRCAGDLARSSKRSWPMRENRPRRAWRSSRFTTRERWFARRSPTSATRS